MLLIKLFILLNIAQTDTLTQVYSDIWEGYQPNESMFSKLMTSNDMIFVVLGVSLIIWFTLLAYLFITDRKLSRLEKEFSALNTNKL